MAKIKYETVTSSLVDAIENGFSELESLGEEMGEWRDSLEERFSSTEKYERVSEVADTLENIVGNKPDVDDDTPELTVTYQHGRKSSRKSPYPRWLRRDNATAAIRSAIDALDNYMSELDENADVDDLTVLRDALEEAADEADAVDFPGAFG